MKTINKEIPDLDSNRIKVGKTYSTKINFKHKKINEEAIDIRSLGLSGENYYYKKNNPPYYKRIMGSIQELFLRKSVAEKLVKVNAKLKKNRLELYILDCYRPVTIQNYLYNIWYPKYLRKIYPELTNSKVLKKRDQYAAKGYKSTDEIDKDAPPPHSTGAAVDLTLRFIDTKELLFMGTIFDDITEIVHTDYYEKLKNHRILTLSEEEALKNRRLLYWSMKSEGFENYPDEWWHYSFGDQMWAAVNGVNDAFYSCIKK